MSDIDAVDVRTDTEARRAIEAVLLAATDPVEPAILAQLVELPTTRVDEIVAELVAEYEHDGRGFTIARVAGGYRFQTHPAAHPYVERFVLDGQTARLSGPALETLAIVAYKQPISRAQLSAIRGVNVDATLKTLVARGYVEECGHEQTPGNPALFGTTTTFLERLGLDSLSDLPALGDFVPEASIVEALERGLRFPDEVPAAPEAVDLDEPDEPVGRAEPVGLDEAVAAVDLVEAADATGDVDVDVDVHVDDSDTDADTVIDVAAELRAGLDDA